MYWFTQGLRLCLVLNSILISEAKGKSIECVNNILGVFTFSFPQTAGKMSNIHGPYMYGSCLWELYRQIQNITKITEHTAVKRNFIDTVPVLSVPFVTGISPPTHAL